METLTIGLFAERGGVNLETIRYYEREGHSSSAPEVFGSPRLLGDRCWSSPVHKAAQDYSFSLADIREILRLKIDPNQLCTDVLTQIDAKTNEVEKKIRHLESIERTLTRMKASCDGHRAVSECPIIESFDAEYPV